MHQGVFFIIIIFFLLSVDPYIHEALLAQWQGSYEERAAQLVETFS